MKTKRIILFRVGTILLLLVIAGIMMVIGRGHTVYLDNKTIDYDGQTYKSPYKIVVSVDGEQIAKLYDKERGMSTCIGQKFDMTLEVTQEKGDDAQAWAVSLALPYGMDGIAINLPAFLAGLPEEAYLSVFQPAPAVEEESAEATDEIPPVDEFALGDV